MLRSMYFGWTGMFLYCTLVNVVCADLSQHPQCETESSDPNKLVALFHGHTPVSFGVTSQIFDVGEDIASIDSRSWFVRQATRNSRVQSGLEPEISLQIFSPNSRPATFSEFDERLLSAYSIQGKSNELLQSTRSTKRVASQEDWITFPKIAFVATLICFIEAVRYLYASGIWGARMPQYDIERELGERRYRPFGIDWKG